MTDDIKDLDLSQKEKKTREVHEAMNELKELCKKGLSESAEGKSKIEKLEKTFADYEGHNQKLVKEQVEAKSREVELKERLDVLETRAYSLGGNADEAITARKELDAFNSFLVKGMNGVTQEQKQILMGEGRREFKYLRTDSFPDGGALAPTQYTGELIKDITESSPMRRFAKVSTTNAVSATHYKRDALVSVYWSGEGVAATASNSKYGQIEIPMHELRAEVNITQKSDLLSAVNMAGEIQSDVVEKFTQAEGLAFVSGNAINKPEGFVTNSDIGTLTSSTSGTFTKDDIIDLAALLKTGYSPMYAFNRQTAGFLRKLSSSSDEHTFFEYGNLAAGLPNMINGYPYSDEFIDMDDEGTAGNKPIAFGDFKRGYNIVDSTAIIVQRNPYRTSGFIIYEFARFLGGQVIQPEAIKILTMKA